MTQDAGGHEPEFGVLYVSSRGHISRQSGCWLVWGACKLLKSGTSFHYDLLPAALSYRDDNVSPRVQSNQWQSLEPGQEKKVSKKLRSYWLKANTTNLKMQWWEIRDLLFEHFRDSIIFVMLSRFPPKGKHDNVNINKEYTKPKLPACFSFFLLLRCYLYRKEIKEDDCKLASEHRTHTRDSIQRLWSSVSRFAHLSLFTASLINGSENIRKLAQPFQSVLLVSQSMVVGSMDFARGLRPEPDSCKYRCLEKNRIAAETVVSGLLVLKISADILGYPCHSRNLSTSFIQSTTATPLVSKFSSLSYF